MRSCNRIGSTTKHPGESGRRSSLGPRACTGQALPMGGAEVVVRSFLVCGNFWLKFFSIFIVSMLVGIFTITGTIQSIIPFAGALNEMAFCLLSFTIITQNTLYFFMSSHFFIAHNGIHKTIWRLLRIPILFTDFKNIQIGLAIAKIDYNALKY